MNKANLVYVDGDVPFYLIDFLDKQFNVKAFFTTNAVSTWKFNLQNSIKNYKALAKKFNISYNDFCTTHQTHTNICKVVDYSNCGDGVVNDNTLTNFDAITTDKQKLMLCSFEADCVPVYFCDPVKKVIAISHSGWRGTCDCISLNTVLKMKDNFDCSFKDIVAVIGPCACKNCYEVKYDLLPHFEKNFGRSVIEKIFIKKSDKLFLDMRLAIEATLLDAGLNEKNIYYVDMCTIESQNLCSFRRTKSTVDHILTAIIQ